MKFHLVHASILFRNPGIISVIREGRKVDYRSAWGSFRTLYSALIRQSAHDLLRLPISCPGCGAYAQVEQAGDAGFFSIERKPVRAYLEHFKEHGARATKSTGETDTLCTGEANVDEAPYDLAFKKAQSPSLGPQEITRDLDCASAAPPFCDRCHKLLHHSIGTPIAHPSIESLQEMIHETSYRENHIYHVVDAADFPMSLVPNLQQRLSLNPQRSRNRRAKSHTFRQGRLMEISYIITRADLLAPTREQVNRLMPYVIEVLRDALGHTAQDLRLGNVRFVSAHRGWWTREVKEDVWNRGGCGWMVGKANVGKSQLLQCIFPKGRNETLASPAPRKTSINNTSSCSDGLGIIRFHQEGSSHSATMASIDRSESAQHKLLPPKPLESDFPIMPIVSPLPGTTAAPIRLPFGNGKGELVDLPGLDRIGFEAYVADEQRQGLVMESRPKPNQISIKPGQTLLVGNMVRITPYNSDVVFLAFPFVPVSLHVTSATRSSFVKSKDTTDQSQSTIDSQDYLASAGIHDLAWDVTKQRSGPLTRRNALGMRSEALPFIIFSVDVVLEGIGWIELVAQVRRRAFEDSLAHQSPSAYPQIEIASRGGRHVTLRRPMNASLMVHDRNRKAKQSSRSGRGMKAKKT